MKKSTIEFHAGDIYAFHTSPATAYSPGETNRFASFKVLAIKDDTIYYVVLDGIFEVHPDFEQAQQLDYLKCRSFSYEGEVACGSTAKGWPVDLLEIRYLGRAEITKSDQLLMNNNIGFSTWDWASAYAECEWRWRHDRDALVAEIAMEEEAEEKKRQEHQKKLETRLKKLTWEQLLSETLLEKWDEHPPYPDAEITGAARKQLKSTIRKIQSLGAKPKKAAVRAILKECVEWFNQEHLRHNEFIETEEREDICDVLEEISYVARQHSLMMEIDEWRIW